MDSFFVDNSTKDSLLIRLIGHPIVAKGFEQMVPGDIFQEKAEITKNSPTRIFKRKIVICIFTLVSKFTYKGTSNDDLPTFPPIFTKVNNFWKIHSIQK